MSPPDSKFKAQVDRARRLWTDASPWGGERGERRPTVRVGRKPLRIAIRPLDELIAPKPTSTLAEARAKLGRSMSSWPHDAPRLAIAGDTGLGKTYNAVQIAARHVVGGGEIEGTLLIAAHNRVRVGEVAALIRARITQLDGDPEAVQELHGRQPLRLVEGDTWTTRSFGCANYDEARRHGRRRRSVHQEVCRTCPSSADCQRDGYLAHTKRAEQARVIVTTIHRLKYLPERVWMLLGAVICDEDVIPVLQDRVRVRDRDLRRAVRFLRRAATSPSMASMDRRARAYYLPVLPLIKGLRSALRRSRRLRGKPVVDHLPEACEMFLTAEGRQALLAARPVRFGEQRGRRRPVPRASMAAPWETRRGRRVVRQVWGALLDALLADLSVPDTAGYATVHIQRTRRRNEAVLDVLTYRRDVVERLRRLPLLVLDATLHPAACSILRLERHDIHYDQGRHIVQALTSLHDARSLVERDGRELSEKGRRAVAVIAEFASGRPALVLAKKALKPLLEAEARRYSGLRSMTVVTPMRERGWDADDEANVFVVLGRYARPELSCQREARAIRSLVWQLDGSVQALDELPTPAPRTPFRGRGKVVLHHGEPVERKTRIPDDALAAAIQEADRIATVVQFLGRNRSGTCRVLLLRGDPTVPVDALIDANDLPEAIPAKPDLLRLVVDDVASGHHKDVPDTRPDGGDRSDSSRAEVAS